MSYCQIRGNPLRNLKTLLAATAVLSLSATPAVANSAAALSPARSLASVKAVTSPKKANKLASSVLIGVGAAVVIIGAVALTSNDDDSDSN